MGLKLCIPFEGWRIEPEVESYQLWKLVKGQLPVKGNGKSITVERTGLSRNLGLLEKNGSTAHHLRTKEYLTCDESFTLYNFVL